MRRTMLILIMIFSIFLASCAGGLKQQKGTNIGSGVGAGIGAIVGQAIGRDTEGTLIGAGIGAIVGGIAGNQVGATMDRQEQDLREAMAASEAANVQRVKNAEASFEVRADQRARDVLTATFRSEVLFDFDSAILKPGAYVELDRVAVVLKKYPQTSIKVEGHTDSRGTDAYNQELSERRARAVREVLIQQGIDSSRIVAVGYGETRPVSSDDTMNRRVIILVEPKERAVG